MIELMGGFLLCFSVFMKFSTINMHCLYKKSYFKIGVLLNQIGEQELIVWGHLPIQAPGFHSHWES